MTAEPDSGWDSALAAAFEEHQRELQVFCYRMTGSLLDAQDLAQETFLRAWRGRESFRRDASVRTWLYRIATNACLDLLARHERRATPSGSLAEVLEHDDRIDPFPDQPASSGLGSSALNSSGLGADPAVLVHTRETTALLLVAALLHLPPRQRAALVARDFLELSAAETATLLQASVPSVNSLVQRARAHVRRLDGAQPEVPPADPQDRALVRRYVQAHQDGDVESILAMLDEDVRVSMPPEQPCVGLRDVAAFFRHIAGSDAPGAWRLVPVAANGRHATANYLRRPGDSGFTATSVDVLDVQRGRIRTVNCFLGSRTFPAFGLPTTLG